jgi:hypothetical protein
MINSCLRGLNVLLSLLGVAISQVWRYYNNFPKDPVYLKLIVSSSIILDPPRSTLKRDLFVFR